MTPSRISHLSFAVIHFILVMTLSQKAWSQEQELKGFLKGEGPIEITAESLSYRQESGIILASGDVLVTKGEVSIRAGRVEVDLNENTVHASEGVIYSDGRGLLKSDEAWVDFDTEVGIVLNGEFDLLGDGYHIEGAKIERLGPDRYYVSDGSLTTCRCRKGPLPWRIRGRELNVELGGYATVRGAVLEAWGVPIFYLPYGFYPVKTERQTGLLMPSFHRSGRNGYGFEIPFFWALHDRGDLTVTLHSMTKRGVKPTGRLRYALKGGEGEIEGTWIDDWREGKDRWALSARLGLENSNGAYLRWDVRLISDDHFLEDFHLDVGERSQRAIESRARIGKRWENGYLDISFSYFEDLTTDLFLLPVVWPEIPDSPTSGLPSTADVRIDTVTMQRLPVVSAGVPVTRLPGLPATVEVSASFVNFAPDNGTMSLSLEGSPEIRTPIQGTHRRRMEISPAIRMPIHLGPYIEFSPGFGLYAIASDVGEPGGTIRSRLLTELSAVLATTLSKVYRWRQLSLKHIVRPELTYLYLDSPVREEFPVYDGLDEYISIHRIGLSLQSRLYARSGSQDGKGEAVPLARIRISGALDIDEALGEDGGRSGETGEPPCTDIAVEAEIVPVPGLSLSADAVYDPRGERFIRTSALMSFFYGNGNSLSAGVQHGRNHWVSGSTRPELSGTLVRSYQAEEVPLLLLAGGRLTLLQHFSLFLQGRYMLDGGGRLEHVIGVDYRSQCDCWEIRFLMRKTERPDDLDFAVKFNLLGF